MDAKVVVSGRKAATMGRAMEDAAEDFLVRYGFTPLSKKQKALFLNGIADLGELGDRWYVRNAKRFLSIYKVRLFSDFVLYDRLAFPSGLILEIKSQESAGSVDEKYVYTVLSLKQAGVPAWLVFSGGGIRACAMDWMKSQESKTFRVLTENAMRRALLEALDVV